MTIVNHQSQLDFWVTLMVHNRGENMSHACGTVPILKFKVPSIRIRLEIVDSLSDRKVIKSISLPIIKNIEL